MKKIIFDSSGDQMKLSAEIKKHIQETERELKEGKTISMAEIKRNWDFKFLNKIGNF